MIGYLKGRILWKGERFFILETGGVGYKLYPLAETLKTARVGPVELGFWTHLAVRDDALDLYGFQDRVELEFFELLLSVSGIGPKSALAILSLAPPVTLRKAISAGDSGYLTKVSGLGRKSAEKIVLELKDKLGAITAGETQGDLREEAEAIQGLQALGYSLREAREALQAVPIEITDTTTKIKIALKSLNRK